MHRAADHGAKFLHPALLNGTWEFLIGRVVSVEFVIPHSRSIFTVDDLQGPLRRFKANDIDFDGDAVLGERATVT